MFNSTKNLKLKGFLRVLASTVIDAFLGSVCGAFYGLVFGGLGFKANADATQLQMLVMAFSICGAMAGALIGARGLIPQANNTTTIRTGSVSELIDEQTATPTTRLRFVTRTPAQPPIQVAG